MDVSELSPSCSVLFRAGYRRVETAQEADVRGEAIRLWHVGGEEFLGCFGDLEVAGRDATGAEGETERCASERCKVEPGTLWV